MVINIDAIFEPYVAAALERLRYLHSDCSFTIVSSTISVVVPGTVSEAELRRDVSYQLYREKIYHESLPMRAAMHAALFE